MSKIKNYVIEKMNKENIPYFPDITVDLRRYRNDSSEIIIEVTKSLRTCKVSEFLIEKYQKDAMQNRSCDAKLVASKWVNVKD